MAEQKHGLMQNDMREYGEGTDITYNTDPAKDYAKYMVEQIINVRENDNTGYGS